MGIIIAGINLDSWPLQISALTFMKSSSKALHLMTGIYSFLNVSFCSKGFFLGGEGE